MSGSIELVRKRVSLDTGEGLRLGDPVTAGSLALFPVFHEWAPVEYLTYAEAGTSVRIAELGDGGTVPSLLVDNRAQLPVLLVEGEILAGLKQTRVLNTTVLVPPGTRTEIPVACVEAGRWARATDLASKDDFHLSPRVRDLKMRATLQSLRARASYATDQGAVWGSVSERLRQHGVASDTGSYADVGLRRRQEIRAMMRALEPQPGQTGVLAMVAGKPLCMDVFDKAPTLRALWPGLIGSYVADALLEAGAAPDADRARAWLTQIAEGEATAHPAVGLGTTVAITAREGSASALVADGTIVHAAVIAREDESMSGRAGWAMFRPPSERRRR